ncbi:MAG: hypothetical protein JSV91_14925 [Phycisphaerales bacterium]|nr:MAG: hypothetical protein JSV91_14925 [Phycisphaerales bacterium]
MNSRDRLFPVALAAFLALALTLGGCKDSAAEQREKTHEAIAAAAESIASATLVRLDPSDPDFANVERSLREAIGDLRKIREGEGEDGQLAAKHMLAATALRELALMSLAQAEEIEARHRQQRAVILSNVRAAGELETTALALEQIETQSHQRELEQVRNMSLVALDQFNRRLAELDEPIAERTAQNARDAQEATRLTDQANALRRQSAESGYADGFSTYERAIGLERQADRIEYDISQRRIELDFQLQPEHDLVKARADQMEALLQAVEASEGDLDDLAQLTADTAAATRRAIADLRQSLASTLNELTEESITTLNDLYAKVGDDLTQADSEAGKAAAKAGRASSGPRSEDGNDAKVLEARINELQGRMHWDIARVAADRAVVLRQLLLTGDLLGDPQAFQSQLSSAEREYEGAIGNATRAYQSAQSTLATVRGSEGQREVEAFKIGVDTALAKLTGSPMPEAPVPSSPPAGGDISASTSGTGGAESPEALIAALKQMDSGISIAGMFDLMIPLTEVSGMDPTVRQALEGILSMYRNMGRLETALQTAFGKGLQDLPGFTGGAGPSIDDIPTVVDAVLEDVSDDRGSVFLTLNDGTSQSVPITMIGNQWYLGSPEEYVGDLGGMGEMTGGAGDEMDEMGMAMLTGMSQMFSLMGRVMGDAAVAINDGQFATFEDFITDFEQRAAEAAGGMGMPTGGFDG